MPGSNPLFGLNALGGAIAIETKDGCTHPGTRAEVYGGSFSRIGVQAETGGDRRPAQLLRHRVTAEHAVSDTLMLAGNVYVRDSDIATSS